MTFAMHSTSPRTAAAALIDACCTAIETHASYLDELDAAIGDGDHGTNMRRGALAVRRLDGIGVLSRGAALRAIGETAIMSIGGAAGPLYGTLFAELGRGLPDNDPAAAPGPALVRAVDAVARRGRSQPGDKTMLDVLYPLRDAVLGGASWREIGRAAPSWAEATRDLRALKGRASYLGERSIGHVDPGAASAALIIAAACSVLTGDTP